LSCVSDSRTSRLFPIGRTYERAGFHEVTVALRRDRTELAESAEWRRWFGFPAGPTGEWATDPSLQGAIDAQSEWLSQTETLAAPDARLVRDRRARCLVAPPDA